MAALEIRQLGDPILRTVCKPVGGERAKIVTRQLIETAKKHNAAGLAANQIGSDARIAVVRVGGGQYQVLSNPRIVFASGLLVDLEECLSLPGLRLRIPRAASITVATADGKKHRFVNRIARAVQHEIDHLDGILIIDRAKVDESSVSLSA